MFEHEDYEIVILIILKLNLFIFLNLNFQVFFIKNINKTYHNGTTTRLHRSHQINISNATGAKHVAIGKVLRGNVANGQLGEDD